jgi:uncharacterized protein
MMNYESKMERVWKIVLNKTTVPKYSPHGPEHWKRVERNGLTLAEETGADKTVVSLFALFHDCMRLNDGIDLRHGLRGAEFMKSIQDQLDLTEEQFEILYFACQWHTDQTFSDNPTIATCWDADRLDLGRVGILPDIRFLNTESAKETIQKKHSTLKPSEVKDSIFWHLHRPILYNKCVKYDNPWVIGEIKHIGNEFNPGWRTLNHYNAGDFVYLKLVEDVLEEIRLKHFPDKPSRIKGLFVCQDDRKSMERWLEILIYNTELLEPMPQMIKLSLMGNIHCGNFSHVRRYLNEIDLENCYESAFKYWRSEPGIDPNEPEEYVFTGEVKVLDVIPLDQFIKQNGLTSIKFHDEVLPLFLFARKGMHI